MFPYYKFNVSGDELEYSLIFGDLSQVDPHAIATFTRKVMPSKLPKECQATLSTKAVF